jgi:hypothetical protein
VNGANMQNAGIKAPSASTVKPPGPGLTAGGWGHPGIPDCASCPLTEVCPKEIERAAHVTAA